MNKVLARLLSLLFLISCASINAQLENGPIPEESKLATRALPFCTGITGPVAAFCNVAISDDLCVQGNVTVFGSISGATESSTNYVFAYDTTDQSVASPGTGPFSFQDINVSTNGQINGWTHAANSAEFTAAQIGLYLIQYDAIVGDQESEAYTVKLRAVIDDVEVAGSVTTLQVPAEDSEFSVEITRSFLTPITAAGQVLKFQLTGSSTNVQLVSDDDGVVSPSITITVTRIA